MVAAADGALHMARHHVHPARALDLGCRPSSVGDQHGMGMIQFDDTAEAARPIAEDLDVSREAPLVPVGERDIVETANRLDDGEGRVLQRLVGGYGHDERLLVLRPAPELAAVTLATKVSIINLYDTLELARCFALGHGLHDLVFELSVRVVAHPKVAFEPQRRQIGLAGRQQVHGLEPRRERQSASCEHRFAGQRRLVAAGATLVVHPSR